MEDRKWKAIEPTEVKNAIELFDGGWMALAAGNEKNFNAMTVSWGQMGELWGKRIVTVYVRDSRYTKEFMDSNEYFSLSAFPVAYKKALGYIGSHSGRDGDKYTPVDLHPEFTKLGNPTFKEAELYIECRTIYKYRIDNVDNLDESIRKWYQDGDMHTVYVGEIVNVMER